MLYGIRCFRGLASIRGNMVSDQMQGHKLILQYEILERVRVSMALHPIWDITAHFTNDCWYWQTEMSKSKVKAEHTWYSTSLWANPMCLQCFDAVGWAAGRASGLLKNFGGCGGRGAVSPVGVAPTRTVGSSASIIFPCSIKTQKTGGGETQPERSTAPC